VCAPGARENVSSISTSDKFNVASRTSTPPLTKSNKLDDVTEKLQKGPRHFLDAVKVPVNGKGKGASIAPDKDSKGSDPNAELEKHPNHEIFTENPSSPTDDVEEEVGDLRMPAFGHKATPETRASPVVESCKSGSGQTRASPLLDNCKTVASRSSPALETSKCASPGISDSCKNNQDRTKRVDSLCVKSDSMARNNDLGPPKPHTGHNNEKRVNLDVSEDTSSHSAWKRTKDKSDWNSPGSNLCNPGSSISDKVTISKESVTVNRTSSPCARTSMLSSTKEGQGSPLCSDQQSKRTNASVKHAKSIASCPSSPVSSPEDGLVIDFPGSPRSAHSPAILLTATSSAQMNRSINSSPVILHHTAGLTDSRQKTSSSPQRRPIKNIVSTPKSLKNSTGSPGGSHSSLVDIDDDLMDEALML
jgi:hypothetical protein